MAYLVIHRSTDTVRIALVIQRSRNPAHVCRHIIDDLVNLCRVHPLMDRFLYVIEHCDIDLTALFDLPDLFRVLDDLMGGARRPLPLFRKGPDAPALTLPVSLHQSSDDRSYIFSRCHTSRGRFFLF